MAPSGEAPSSALGRFPHVRSGAYVRAPGRPARVRRLGTRTAAVAAPPSPWSRRSSSADSVGSSRWSLASSAGVSPLPSWCGSSTIDGGGCRGPAAAGDGRRSTTRLGASGGTRAPMTRAFLWGAAILVLGGCAPMHSTGIPTGATSATPQPSLVCHTADGGFLPAAPAPRVLPTRA